MKKVYIISTCIKKNKIFSIFHFKGFYRGEKIKEIKIKSSEFDINKEYLIKLIDPYVYDEVLFGDLERSKALFV